MSYQDKLLKSAGLIPSDNDELYKEEIRNLLNEFENGDPENVIISLDS